MGTSIIGPIQRRSSEKTTGKSAPQVMQGNDFDSRLHRTGYGCKVLPYHKIRELRRDPTVYLAKLAVLAPMMHTAWVYEPANNKKPSQEMLQFIEENFTPVRDFFLQQAVFGTLDFGWQPFEIVYEPAEGMTWLNNIKALLHDFTDILIYLDTGGFAGFINEPPSILSAVEIPQQYALNINFEIEGTDWYGNSVYNNLQSVLKAWDEVEKVSNRYDRKIAGATWVVHFPVGHTPYNGVNTSNQEIASIILRGLESSGMAAIPSELQEWVDDTIDHEAKGKWQIELLSADSGAQASFIDRQKYLDALKMRAFGFPERSILEGKHGTKEEADVHADIALSIVDTRHRLLCRQLNEGPVRQLMLWNYGEKWANAVCVKPAPLIDAQFALVKEIYRVLLQNPKIAEFEAARLNLESVTDELGLPSASTALNLLDYLKQQNEKPQNGQVHNT